MDAGPLAFQKRRKPSIEDVEGEFNRVVESPAEEIEVCRRQCDDLADFQRLCLLAFYDLLILCYCVVLGA